MFKGRVQEYERTIFESWFQTRSGNMQEFLVSPPSQIPSHATDLSVQINWINKLIFQNGKHQDGTGKGTHELVIWTL